jgi:cation diffusion facilitator family transporter
MARESRTVVIAAILANVAIAIVKFLAALNTRSSSMISEGVHSLVDSGNEALLLVGLGRAAKKPDKMHPFGYGKELYFWSFVVAILIFSLGGGVSIYEGIVHILNPEPLRNAKWNYVVLGCAFLFEGTSFLVALREFRRRKKSSHGLMKGIQASKDPSVFTVLVEDAAALMGLSLAFLGVFFSHWLGAPKLDGVASLAIGALLVTVALLLANESRNLLIGESLKPEAVESIREILCATPGVEDYSELLSMHLGPREVLLNLRLRFRPGQSRQEVNRAIQQVEEKIRSRHPEVSRIFFASDSFHNGEVLEEGA